MAVTMTNKRFQNFLTSPTSTQRIHDLANNRGPTAAANQKLTNNLTNFLTTYFNFAFAVCCSPFRLASDQYGWFTKSSILPQKIVCALLNSTGVMLMLTNLRTKISATASAKNQNPLEYFSLLSSIFSTSFQTFTLKQFWTNQDDFVNIVNFIRSERNVLPLENIRILNKRFSQLICAIFTVMPLYEVIWKKLFASSPSWEQTIWNTALAAEGRYVFFLTNHSESQKTLKPEQLGVLDYFLGIFVGLGWVGRYILGFYIDLFMLFTVLTVWTTCYSFSRKLEDDMKRSSLECNWSLLTQIHIPSIALTQHIKRQPGKNHKSNWSDIYRTYQSIRNLCELVNKAFGTLITLYLADCILFQSTSMDAVLITSEWRVRARLLFFICNYAFVFILSADACNHVRHILVESLKYWLAKDENRRDIPSDVLNMIMCELQSRMVGIRGSNIFTVTFPLLWNVLRNKKYKMITTVVTYFIICLQTRQQEHGKDAGAQIVTNCTGN